MNYIPGFSNHLETSVPQYAEGGPVMGGVALTPEEREARRIAANTLPQGTFLSAPMDNLGKGTGYDIAGQGSNLFEYRGGPVRVTDRNGKVLFSGEGPEGALAAAQFAQNLTDTKGQKASWDIQQGERTINPDGSVGDTRWVSGPTDFNEGSAIRDFIGTALPLAVMAIPGLNVLGSIAAGAAFGGAGAAFKGDDILKGAAMGGLGAAGGKILGPALEAGGALGTSLAPRLATAVGTGLGSTVGGVATGQSLKDALIGGVVSGGLSYASPDISKALGVGTPASTSTSSSSTSAPSFDGILVNATPAIAPSSIGYTLGGSSPSKLKLPETTRPEIPYDGILVNATPAIGPSSVGYTLGSGSYGAPGSDTSAFDRLTDTADPNEILVKANPLIQPTPVSVPVTGGLSPDVLAGIAEFEKNPIISEGSKIERPTSGTFMPTDLGVIDRVSDMENYKDPIVVEGSKIVKPEPTSVTVMPPVGPVAEVLPPMKPDPALTDKDGNKLGLEEYLRLLALVTGAAGGGGSGSPGTYTPGGRGLNPIFSAQLPAAGGLGTIGANRTVRPLGDVDWLTYGERPELNFFNYSTSNTPAPITSPIPNEPAGPSMYAPDVDDMRFARGGAMPARRGGSSDRTEFAVNGPGTGRSDDIPAVLSDGEYVIDAETVALLGDGSSKAGAKKLDDLRVKVRKHKGKKLAKGRFSANAKKPEAYLSGGRI